MSPLANSRLGLLGNPENRRVRDFTQAAISLGYPEPIVVSYQALLADRDWDRLRSVDCLRIESPGENAAVARALIRLGGGPEDADLEHGEVAYLKEYHKGFLALLEQVSGLGLPCLSPAEEIGVMFDKWACHQRFVQAGLARPPARLAPPCFAALREELSGHGRLFLKPLHGSSASGVCALRWAPGRVQMMAPLRLLKGRLINDRRVARWERMGDIASILERLLPQGMIAEHWVPKLSLDDGVVDLRVLVIANEARHLVVRQSHQTMTNLHLGNRRGCPDELRARLGEAGWESALSLARAAARCFPRSLYAGIDILLDQRGRALVGEINAFGDLIPGLTDRNDSAYTAILKAHYAQSCPV